MTDRQGRGSDPNALPPRRLLIDKQKVKCDPDPRPKRETDHADGFHPENPRLIR